MGAGRAETKGRQALLWIEGVRNVGIGVASTLIATGLISAVVAATLAFSHAKPTSASAFHLLLAVVIIGALIGVTAVIIQLVYASKFASGNRTLIGLTRTLSAKLESLESRIPTIDWSYDAAEHDRRVYERIRKVIDNPATHEFKVLAIFRDPTFSEVSELQREGIRDYHKSLELALQRRSGFVYERLVVLRGALKGGQKSGKQLLSDLIVARPDFIEHCRRIFAPHALRAEGARVDIRFYADTGRLFDLAFAVAVDRDRKPLTLLLEIGVTRPATDANRSEHPVLGILALDNPNQQLAEAFLLAHQALLSGSTSVEHIRDEIVRSAFQI